MIKKINSQLILKSIRMLGLSLAVCSFSNQVQAQLPIESGNPAQALLNEPVDISSDFRNFSNTYFVADSLSAFDPGTGNGTVKWMRNVYQTRQAFSNMLAFLRPIAGNEFPPARALCAAASAGPLTRRRHRLP